MKRLFKDIPPSKLKVVEGLIIQAARLRVLLNEMWMDISENGDYEMFSQSDKTERMKENDLLPGYIIPVINHIKGSLNN